MPAQRATWTLTATGATLAVVLVSAAAFGLGGWQAAVDGGESVHVQVVDSHTLGVIAGMVTVEESGLFGFQAKTTPAEGGWAVVHPEGLALPGDGALEARVTDDLAFTDPNGATWMAHEASFEGGTIWVVPIGSATHDPTLEADYNFALVVDWSQVPADEDLTVTHLPELTLR